MIIDDPTLSGLEALTYYRQNVDTLLAQKVIDRDTQKTFMLVASIMEISAITVMRPMPFAIVMAMFGSAIACSGFFIVGDQMKQLIDMQETCERIAKRHDFEPPPTLRYAILATKICRTMLVMFTVFGITTSGMFGIMIGTGNKSYPASPTTFQWTLFMVHVVGLCAISYATKLWQIFKGE